MQCENPNGHGTRNQIVSVMPSRKRLITVKPCSGDHETTVWAGAFEIAARRAWRSQRKVWRWRMLSAQDAKKSARVESKEKFETGGYFRRIAKDAPYPTVLLRVAGPQSLYNGA
jgi:hypothetical protein